MRIVKTVLTDCLVLEHDKFGDRRGSFSPVWNAEKFEKLLGYQCVFVQDNESVSAKGTLRGLHLQRGSAAQAKLVRVTHGRAFDVAVDTRAGSPTFGQWFGLELDGDDNQLFFVPRGFAHGFLALRDNTKFQYKVDNSYSARDEDGILWNDSTLKIDWPMENPILSKKDLLLKSFDELCATESKDSLMR